MSTIRALAVLAAVLGVWFALESATAGKDYVGQNEATMRHRERPLDLQDYLFRPDMRVAADDLRRALIKKGLRMEDAPAQMNFDRLPGDPSLIHTPDETVKWDDVGVRLSAGESARIAPHDDLVIGILELLRPPSWNEVIELLEGGTRCYGFLGRRNLLVAIPTKQIGYVAQASFVGRIAPYQPGYKYTRTDAITQSTQFVVRLFRPMNAEFRSEVDRLELQIIRGTGDVIYVQGNWDRASRLSDFWWVYQISYVAVPQVEDDGQGKGEPHGPVKGAEKQLNLEFNALDTRELVGALEAADGQGVIIGVLDDGCKKDHSAFNAYNKVDPRSDPIDIPGLGKTLLQPYVHGTLVSGVLLGRHEEVDSIVYEGVASQAKLYFETLRVDPVFFEE